VAHRPPLAFGVGRDIGAAEFVPYVGPILAIVPSVLVAATVNVRAMAWTFGAYVLIHQIEGNLIMPIIQRQLIHIPPAFMLFSIVASACFSAGGHDFRRPDNGRVFRDRDDPLHSRHLDEAPASSGMPDS